MKILGLSASLMAAGLLLAAPSFAQTSTPQTPTTKTRHAAGDVASTGAAGKASKQRTDGNSPTTVGPGSAAYYNKQRAQSFSHSDGSPAAVTKQN